MPLVVEGEERVGDALDDRDDAPVGLAERLLRQLALGDLRDAALVVDDPVRRVGHRLDVVFDPDGRAVVPAHLRGKASNHPVALEQRLEPRALVGVDVEVHRVDGQERLPVRITQHLDEGRVRVGDSPRGRRPQKPDGHAVEQAAEPLLGGLRGDARLLLAGEQGGVLDGDRRVLTQPEKNGLVPVRERARRPVIRVEDAVDLRLEPDRDRDQGHRPLVGHHVDEVAADARVPGVVVRAEGPAARDHERPDAPAGLDAHAREAPEVGAGPVAEDEPFAPGRPERDQRHVALAELAGALGHLLEDRVEVERGVDRARELRHDLGFAPAPLGVRVEPGVLEGHGRLVGERLGQPHVTLGERPPGRIGGGERADHPVFDD